jgi:hypothetical protein
MASSVSLEAPIWIKSTVVQSHSAELAIASGRHSSASRTRSAITAGSSSSANVTVRSNPFPPVMSTRNPPLNGSAAIHPSYGALACLQPATTAASIRSRAVAWDSSDVEDGERHTA